MVPIRVKRRWGRLMAVSLLLLACGGQRGESAAANPTLAPERFAAATPAEASVLLDRALREGSLTYEGTAELVAWLRARPVIWNLPSDSSPLLSYNSVLPRLSPPSQAWLMLAVHWVLPDLATGAPASQSIDSLLPVLVWRQASPLRGLPTDRPEATALVLDTIRRRLGEAWRDTLPGLSNSAAELVLLATLAPADHRLAADYAGAGPRLTPSVRLVLARVLFARAAEAPDSAARAELATLGTDWYLDAEVSPVARTRVYQSWTNREAPVVAEINRRFLARAANERCPDFGDATLPVDGAQLADLWVRRFTARQDGLCLWYPPRLVPIDRLLLSATDSVEATLTARPVLFGDALRQDILIRQGWPRVARGLDDAGRPLPEMSGYCPKSDDPVCLGVSRPALVARIRERVLAPQATPQMGRGGALTVRFTDPAMEGRWERRPAAKVIDRGSIAGVAGALGVPEAEVGPLFEREFLPHRCRAGDFAGSAWSLGTLRAVWLTCAADPRTDSVAVWARDASDSMALGWHTRDGVPVFLADGGKARVAWLTQNAWSDWTRLDMLALVDLDEDGAPELVAASHPDPACRGARDCEAESTEIRVVELSQEIFTYFRPGP